MYPVSDKFLRAIRQGGRRRTVCDIIYDGQVVAEDIAVSDGKISVDLDGQIRRSGTITIPDRRFVPTVSDILSPLGTEIRVRQGVTYQDGSEELVPLGLFRLDVTSWDELARVPSIQIYDRSKALQAALPSPHSRAGQWASDVISAFVVWFYPGIEVAGIFDPSLRDYRLPGGHVFDHNDHWGPCEELARNMGGRIYFDVTGLPVVELATELGPDSIPVFEVDAGESGILISANRQYSREGVFNSVQVRGAARENGVTPRATVYNTAGPLRYGGPFGKTGDVIDDSSLTTYDACLRRARAELARYTGLSYSLDFSSVPNPALEAGDIIRAVYPDGTRELHQLSTFTIPLGPGEFTGTSKGVYLHG